MSTNSDDKTEVVADSDKVDQRKQPKPIRWWPALILLLLMLTCRLIGLLFESPPIPAVMAGVMGPPLIGFLLFAWWLLASRAFIREKLIGAAGLILIAGLALWLDHKSMWGMGYALFQMPVGMAAFALPLILFANRYSHRVSIALLGALIGFGAWGLLRFDGVDGEFNPGFSFRFSPTPEEQYLESIANSEATGSTAADSNLVINEANSEWPAFRGRNRTNVVSDVVLDANWEQNPPKLIWKSLVGPGWSSFSVAGKRLFTQEQRGDSEAIVCLDADSGKVIWAYEYPGRFAESTGGAGPRATPTIGEDALYCMGGDGTVTCLKPTTGELVWQRELKEDAGRQPPPWGWASSPLVADSKVIVYAGGEKGIIAYDAKTGDILWTAPSGNHGYSSAQLAEFDGVNGLLMVSNFGLQFLDLQDGHTIWEQDKPSENYRVVQPLVIGNSVLYAGSLGEGSFRVSVSKSGDSWDVTEDWDSRSLKPSFNDFVLHNGHVYGFDHSIFASIDVETGAKNWKRGRYGNGQVLLLDSAGQLLLTSERGELVLLEANPEQHVELAKFPALEGKTWNHSVLIGDRLYLRNGQEAACFQLWLK